MEYAVHCFHPTLHSEPGHITDWRARDNYLTLSLLLLLLMISSYGEMRFPNIFFVIPSLGLAPCSG